MPVYFRAPVVAFQVDFHKFYPLFSCSSTNFELKTIIKSFLTSGPDLITSGTRLLVLSDFHDDNDTLEVDCLIGAAFAHEFLTDVKLFGQGLSLIHI